MRLPNGFHEQGAPSDGLTQRGSLVTHFKPGEGERPMEEMLGREGPIGGTKLLCWYLKVFSFRWDEPRCDFSVPSRLFVPKWLKRIFIKPWE